MGKNTGAKGGKVAGAKGGKAPKAPASPADPAELLEKQIDEETKAPEGAPTAAPAVASVDLKIVKDKETGARRLERPTGQFVSIGSEIFNREGQLVGTEANANDAARKTDRFNGLTRQR